MYNSIICLGKKACDIGEMFQIFSDCNIIKLIDVGIEGEDCYSIQPQKSAEEYEKNTPDLTQFFSNLNSEILFIINGESEVANCSLKILQQIKDKNIYIAYISPQKDFLNNKQILQEKVIRNVLQEYTRSGLFKQMLLFDSSSVEGLMEQATIKNFDAKYNQTIISLLRSYFYLQGGEVIIDQFNQPSDVCRILTLGYYDLKSDIERAAYNLSYITDKAYHFFLSDKTLNGDAAFLKDLKNKIKNKSIDNVRTSYTIRTSRESDFCFVVYYSKLTQQ